MNIVEVTYRWAKPLYRRSSTDYIIIHHEAGNGQTPQSIHQQHIAQGWAGFTTMFSVDSGGTVTTTDGVTRTTACGAYGYNRKQRMTDIINKIAGN